MLNIISAYAPQTGCSQEEKLQFAQAYDLGVVNTFSQKKMEHLITYKSGGRRSVIDYILIRRNNISKVKDFKVIPGESIATQHIILTMDIGIQIKNHVGESNISSGGD